MKNPGQAAGAKKGGRLGLPGSACHAAILIADRAPYPARRDEEPGRDGKHRVRLGVRSQLISFKAHLLSARGRGCHAATGLFAAGSPGFHRPSPQWSYRRSQGDSANQPGASRQSPQNSSHARPEIRRFMAGNPWTESGRNGYEARSRGKPGGRPAPKHYAASDLADFPHPNTCGSMYSTLSIYGPGSVRKLRVARFRLIDRSTREVLSLLVALLYACRQRLMNVNLCLGWRARRNGVH